MWEAAPCSTLPAADENAVTDLLNHGVFQLVPVSHSSYEELRDHGLHAVTSKQKETATTDLFQDSQRADPCK